MLHDGRSKKTGWNILSSGLAQTDIVCTLATNHNIIISEHHLRQILKTMNLYRRKNYSDIEEVARFINDTSI